MQSQLFKNNYRVLSARRPMWNYTDAAHYFVTIVTGKRLSYFGDIKNGEMVLSPIGAIVQQCWQDIPNHFSFVRLDEFQIMPNHVHGVLEIQNVNHDDRYDLDRRDEALPRLGITTIHPIAINHPDSGDEALPRLYISVDNMPIQQTNQRISNISPKPGSLSAVVGSFKSVCTKLIHSDFKRSFAWQPRFYDRIIRDELELGRIRKYIFENPMKWEQDELYLD